MKVDLYDVREVPGLVALGKKHADRGLRLLFFLCNQLCSVFMRFNAFISPQLQVDLLALGALVAPHSDREDLHARILTTFFSARAYRVSHARARPAADIKDRVPF